MLSIGIDIGTTTTQTVFSRLTVENTAPLFSVPRARITQKKVVYKGEIRFTPYQNDLLVDGDAIQRMVEADFRDAGFAPGDTDTGAVIITGVAARKENAALVTEKLSRFAGDFVVATAGPELEAVLAGKGSGAQDYSKEHGCAVANLDIGGGTTNIAVFANSESVAAGCLDIGGRLLRLGRDGTVAFIAPQAQLVIELLGLPIRVGAPAGPDTLAALVQKLANLIAQEVGLAPQEPILARLRTAGCTPLHHIPHDHLCFSGGVAAYIYGGQEEADPFRFGDIGILLGRAIRDSVLFTGGAPVGGRETIRATVVGAGSYSTTISGSTITVAADRLPLKNIPVLRISKQEAGQGLLENQEALARHIARFRQQNHCDGLALSFHGERGIGYARLEALAAALSGALDEALPPGAPALVVLEADIAKALGQAMGRRLPKTRDVLCIDGIDTSQGDVLDIGSPIMNGLTLPVVVKTLIFG